MLLRIKPAAVPAKVKAGRKLHAFQEIHHVATINDAIATGSTLGVGVCQEAPLWLDSVPSRDVTASCRGAAEAGYMQDTKVNFNAVSIVDRPPAARATESRDWSTFPAADRLKCVKTPTFIADLLQSLRPAWR